MKIINLGKGNINLALYRQGISKYIKPGGSLELNHQLDRTAEGVKFYKRITGSNPQLILKYDQSELSEKPIIQIEEELLTGGLSPLVISYPDDLIEPIEPPSDPDTPDPPKVEPPITDPDTDQELSSESDNTEVPKEQSTFSMDEVFEKLYQFSEEELKNICYRLDIHTRCRIKESIISDMLKEGIPSGLPKLIGMVD